jgi:hypothetical protein
VKTALSAWQQKHTAAATAAAANVTCLSMFAADGHMHQVLSIT